jgi:hypothetical protein
VDAGEQSPVAELVQVFPDRLRRDIEAACQLVNEHAAGLPRDVKNAVLTRNQHR